MNFTKTISIIAAAGALVLPAGASADSLYVPSERAQHLATGGGYMVWSSPRDGGGFQLTVRAPDGAVTAADTPAFRVAPDAAIGTCPVTEGQRRLLAVYGRDGDIYQYDLRAGTESKVKGASTSTYEEYAAGLQYGAVSFVRRGGRNNGIFVLGAKGDLKKVSSARPRELQFNGSRVAYPSGRNVVVRKVSGRGAASTVQTPSPAFGLVLTRYSVTYAVRGGKLLQTNSFGGSGRQENAVTAREASQTFPASLNSIAFSGAFVRYWADAEGIHRISTQNVFR